MPDARQLLIIDAVSASQSLSDSLQTLALFMAAHLIDKRLNVIQVKRPPDFVLPDSQTAMETPGTVMLLVHAPSELRAFISEFLDWIAVCGARDEEVVAMFRDSGLTGNIGQPDIPRLVAWTLGWTGLDFI